MAKVFKCIPIPFLSNYEVNENTHGFVDKV